MPQQDTTYTIKISDKQRSILIYALLTYVTEGGFQGEAAKEDLADGQKMLSALDNQNNNLSTESINDLAADFRL